MDLYKMLKSTEDMRVDVIKSFFEDKKISENINYQINKVLEVQQKVGQNEEIGGSVFWKKSDLEFRIIKSTYSQNIETYLIEVERGNYDHLESLSDLLNRTLDNYKTEFDSENKQIMILDTLKFTLSKAKDTNILSDQKLKDDVLDLYRKYVVGVTHMVDFNEIGLKEKGFLSLFHVHKYGSEPSKVDIRANEKCHLPGLVISATEDYKEMGLTLYLVSKGISEILYQGRL